MSKLPDAIQALTDVSRQQLRVLEEMDRRQRQREAEERFRSPAFRAELRAKQSPLRPFSPEAFIRAAPETFVEAFKGRVPDEFWTQVDEGKFAVACPCGVDHVVDGRGYPTSAVCGRYFLYDGEALLVAFSPRPES